MNKICPICSQEFSFPRCHESRRTTCSKDCSAKFRRKIIGELKQCSKCKQWLPHEEFHKDRKAPGELYRHCKKCQYQQNKEWHLKNREQNRKRSRDYMRKYRIGQNGKDLRHVIGKRDYPNDEKCEICKESVRLVYHHWDNSDFSKGMWICTKCHVAAHWLEKYDPNIFYSLKLHFSQ